MAGPILRAALLAALLAGSLFLPDQPTPAQAPSRQAKYALSKRFRFPDEREIRKDWKLSGEFRIEGQGLRLYDKSAELESLIKYKGDLELVIEFDVSPRRELVVKLWDEEFEFRPEPPKGAKGLIPSVAMLVRKGEGVYFRTGTEPQTTVKLQEKQRDKATPLVLGLDKKSTSKTARELLLRSITVKAAAIER